MKRSHRPLTEQEIATMTVYGCTAEDWGIVEVKDGFDTKFVSNEHFSGNIKLGVFEKIYEMGGGFRKHSGLYNTAIHNCVIGDNVFIDKIHNYIANYEICDEGYI